MSRGCDHCYHRGYMVVWTIPGKTPIYDDSGLQIGVEKKRECVHLKCTHCGGKSEAKEPIVAYNAKTKDAIEWFYAQKDKTSTPMWTTEWANKDARGLYDDMCRLIKDRHALLHESAIVEALRLCQKFSTVEEPAFPGVIEEPAFADFKEEPAF